MMDPLNYAPSIDAIYEDNMTRLWPELSQKSETGEEPWKKEGVCVCLR